MVHEWALAEGVIEVVKAEAEKRSAKAVGIVTVVLGELQAIDEEIFLFALRELSKQLPFQVKDFRLEKERCTFRCRNCGASWNLDELQLNEEIREAIHFVPEAVYAYVRCPKCGSVDFEIVKGRGVYVKSIQIAI